MESVNSLPGEAPGLRGRRGLVSPDDPAPSYTDEATMTYDDWKLDYPSDYDGPTDEEVADFFDMPVEDVSWIERADYVEARMEPHGI